MKRVRTTIGDVFAVQLNKNTKKYFQYIANDRSQLNSPVIRVFKKMYSIDEAPDLHAVVAGEIDFYAHVIIQWGIKMHLWEKVGRIKVIDQPCVIFRDTDDCGHKEGEEPVKVSARWYIWKINEEFQHVGKLEGQNREAEIGVVVAPPDILLRMQTGMYGFVYPGFE